MVPLSHYCWVWVQCTNFLVTNNNALTAAFSLAFLEIRSRNEEAINSTRNRIYSLKVFYFLLYRYRILLYFLSFLRKTCLASITKWFLVPVSMVSTRNAWHNDPPFVYIIVQWKTPWGTSRKIGWGVQHTSWNSYPTSDQNLWFSPPYFRREAL